MYKVVLRQDVVIVGGQAFECRRTILLPIPPFVGMELRGISGSAWSCEEAWETAIEAVQFHYKENELFCFLKTLDFGKWHEDKSDPSGEKAMRSHYSDWTITEYPKTEA